MKYLLSIILVVAFFATAQAQEYKTYKKINDSTFVETRSLEEDEAVELTTDQTLTALFREMDRWAQIENRHYNNMLISSRVFSALRRDQMTLIPDTSYADYNRFRDTIYSYPSLQRDTSNQIIYDSRLTVGDTSYNAQLFRNAGGAQILRLEGPNSSHAARFIESDRTIRVGTNDPLPGLSGFSDLRYIRENERFVLYFGIIENQRVLLSIRKRQ